jgi:hypothetical protein
MKEGEDLLRLSYEGRRRLREKWERADTSKLFRIT